MGNTKKPVHPAIKTKVKRNLDELTIELLSSLIKKGPEPWSVDKRGEPHPPKLVLL